MNFYYITLLEFHYVIGTCDVSEFILHASKFTLHLTFYIRFLFSSKLTYIKSEFMETPKSCEVLNLNSHSLNLCKIQIHLMSEYM